MSNSLTHLPKIPLSFPSFQLLHRNTPQQFFSPKRNQPSSTNFYNEHVVQHSAFWKTLIACSCFSSPDTPPTHDAIAILKSKPQSISRRFVPALVALIIMPLLAAPRRLGGARGIRRTGRNLRLHGCWAQPRRGELPEGVLRR